MSNQNQLAIRDDMQLAEVAQHFVRSGYFQDTADVSKAVVKIMAGREFGFGSFKSMAGIHIIQGRPSLGADLMAAAVKRSERYDYRVREMTDKVCSIEYFERVDGKRETLGVSTFTLEDARKAGTKNLDKFPRNMLFARAMSNGVRWYVPDVFGTAVYTPEELGADVNDNGEVINYTPPVVTVTQPKPENGNGHEQEAVRPYAPEETRRRILDLAAKYAAKGTKANGDRNMIVPNFEKLFAENGSEKRHTVTRYLFGYSSSKDLSDAQLLALKSWMDYGKLDTGEWVANAYSMQEAEAMYTAALAEEGQQALL